MNEPRRLDWIDEAYSHAHGRVVRVCVCVWLMCGKPHLIRILGKQQLLIIVLKGK